MRLLWLLGLAYVAMFLVLVVRGREPDWPGEVGFMYSADERSDQILGRLFLPLCVLARRFGIVRLSHPSRMA
jgi:hypothetical protein